VVHWVTDHGPDASLMLSSLCRYLNPKP
jgi:hypothetical protein